MTRFHTSDDAPLMTDVRLYLGLAVLGLGAWIVADELMGLTSYGGGGPTRAGIGVAAVLLGAWTLRDALEPRASTGRDLEDQLEDATLADRLPDVRAWFGRGKR